MTAARVSRPRGRPAGATREELLATVVAWFLDGRRIDVQAICQELGLSRATVHRWYGSRDELIGTALAGLVDDLFRRIDETGRGRGAERLLDVFERQMRVLADDPALRRFVEAEREAAVRIFTRSEGPMEPRVVARLQSSIEAEMAYGYRPPAEAEVIAYAIVRMGHAFLYTDPSRGFHRDFRRLRAVYAALLGVATPVDIETH